MGGVKCNCCNPSFSKGQRTKSNRLNKIARKKLKEELKKGKDNE